jgi:hypothetical protein
LRKKWATFYTVSKHIWKEDVLSVYEEIETLRLLLEAFKSSDDVPDTMSGIHDDSIDTILIVEESGEYIMKGIENFDDDGSFDKAIELMKEAIEKSDHVKEMMNEIRGE